MSKEAEMDVMPFGKWKGELLSEVPEGALRHYLQWDQLRPGTRAVIEAELVRRAGDAASAAPPPTAEDEVPF